MPLPISVVLNAAVESTDKYFTFLCEKKVGVNRHYATQIHTRDDADLFFENTKWHAFRCSLPPHLSIRSDSSATLVPSVAPGNEIEIRIKDYDRRTGETVFAAQQPVPGETGNVVIDFRWLVKRCLEWLQQRGTSLPEIAEAETWVSEDLGPIVLPDGLSDKQAGAIKTILTSGLCYIWGPPGTGKTEWVLARAACHLVARNKKVLVLAPTNLAVDNAVRAVIKVGVAKEKVIRIGIPSQKFIEEYPECVEERAFQEEIRQTRSQIHMLQDRIDSLQRARQIKEQIKDKAEELEAKRRVLSGHRESLSVVERDLRRSSDVLAQLGRALNPLEGRLDSARSKLAGIAFSKLISEIETLESEQTLSINKVNQLDAELRSLGILTRLFTGRKKQLIDSIAKENAHLQSVEATLKSKRAKRDNFAPVVSQLEAEIVELDYSCKETRRNISTQQSQTSALESRQREFRSGIAETENLLRILEIEIAQKNELLANIGERDQTDRADELLASWRDEISGYEARLAQFRQDLASKSVLGMTLDGFIGLTLQMPISVDHVLIDEASYAPIAKVLPVLSLHKPIAMLGDHCQLPPVCECENDPTICAYWAKAAIFLEDAFCFGNNWNGLNELEKPRFALTQQSTLTDSYRFGQTLASLLDRHIYGEIGLIGLAPDDTCIRCIDCTPHERNGRERRQNDAEVDTILDAIQRWWPWAERQQVLPTLAILTPYKRQVKLIRNKLRERFGNQPVIDNVEVWHTHQAQGREWDWVLFSVSDTANLQGNDPWFCNSTHSVGRALLNTTISRAKQHLRVFLDASYWRQRVPDSMVTDMSRHFTETPRHA